MVTDITVKWCTLMMEYVMIDVDNEDLCNPPELNKSIANNDSRHGSFIQN